MKVMIDTNIILDVLMNRQPFYQASAEVVQLSEDKRIDGYITASTITDIFYMLKKTIRDHMQAKEILVDLLNVVSIADVTESLIIEALNKDWKDFEDALLTSVAQDIRSDYIVTRNLKDFSKAEIPAVGPQELLEMIYS